MSQVLLLLLLVLLLVILFLLAYLAWALSSLAAALRYPGGFQGPPPPVPETGDFLAPPLGPPPPPPGNRMDPNDPEETGLDSAPEEEIGRVAVPIKLLGLNRKITGYASNFLGSSTYLSQIDWSYSEPREHDLVFLFKKVRGLWSETVGGRAVVYINSEVLLSRYSAAYDPGRKELLVSFLDGRNKQLKASGRIEVKMTLGDNDRVIQIDSCPESSRSSSCSGWDSESSSSSMSFSRDKSRPPPPPQPYEPPKISRPNQINFMCR